MARRDAATRRTFLEATLAASAFTRLPAVANPVPGPPPDASPPADRTLFLFLDWFHVKKGELAVTLDPGRISDEGRTLLGTMARDFGKSFDQSGHGFRPVDIPTGVRIVQEVARKSGPWLRPDRPWEKGISSASVLFDEGRFRCWYGAQLRGEKVRVTVDGGRTMELSGGATAYAESRDGLEWTKPDLGILSHPDAGANNLVSPYAFGGTVFRDDRGPAGERYKTFHFDELPRAEVPEGAPPARRYGLYGLASPDGLRWARRDTPLIRYFSDTFNVAARDPLLGKYVGFFRHHLSGRTISRAETADFWAWPEPQPLLYAGPLDAPADDYYTNGYTTYPGDPSLRLLFVAVYHRDTDAVDVRLAVSRDGRAFQWASYAPILGLGGPGEWDGGSIYAQPNLVRLPDGRLALPYNAYDTAHNEAHFRTYYRDFPGTSGVGWANWDDARLAGIRADHAGHFTTNAAKFDGPGIRINARTGRAGTVEVELRERGRPIDGFTFADAVPFSGDETWTACRWKGQADPAALRGRRIELAVRLRDATLFAARFD